MRLISDPPNFESFVRSTISYSILSPFNVELINTTIRILDE